MPWGWWIALAQIATGFVLLWRVPRPGRWGRVRSDVAVVIPARDEADSLPHLLADLAAQLRPGDEIVVVDDSSSDRTAQLAAELGARVVPAGPLPEGWAGKPHACAVGAAATTAPSLVFVDADVRFAPGAVQQVAATLDDCGGLVSVQPWHLPEGPGEQMAAVFNVVSMMGTGAFVPGGGTAQVAFGPVLACRRSDYERAGGHESVKGEVLEDVALARRFRQAGREVRLFGGGPSIGFRMYPRGLGQLAEGFTKNIAAGAGSTNPAVMAAVVFWLSGAIAAPFRGPLRYALFAAQMAVLMRKVGRFHWWVPAAYPVPLAVFLGVFARSVAALALGRPVTWKGRSLGGRG